MHYKELYQHILGLTSPWTVRECSLGGTLAKSTATIAMRQMGSPYQPDSKYQPDAPARESTSLIPPPKNPCWRDGLVMRGKPQLSRGWECIRSATSNALNKLNSPHQPTLTPNSK
jgi:hypothetical protein